MPFLKMEKAVQCSRIASIGGIDLKGFQRVQYGEEFCERLLPDPDVLQKVIGDVRSVGKRFSLVTPFATDKGISKMKCLFKILSPNDEVIVNDFGVLDMVNEEFGNPIFAGRVLGQILLTALMGKEKDEKKEYLSIFGKNFVGVEVDYHNCELVNPHLAEITDFSFNRSLPFWGVTRRCIFVPNFSTLSKFGECNKECLSMKAIVHNSLINREVLVKGNKMLNIDKDIPKKKINYNLFKRIVYKVREQ